VQIHCTFGLVFVNVIQPCNGSVSHCLPESPVITVGHIVVLAVRGEGGDASGI